MNHTVQNLPGIEVRLLKQLAASVDGTGWGIVSDRNIFGNKVILMSETSNLAVVFDHEEPYHRHLRAYCEAKNYAYDHPQSATTQAH